MLKAVGDAWHRLEGSGQGRIDRSKVENCVTGDVNEAGALYLDDGKAGATVRLRG